MIVMTTTDKLTREAEERVHSVVEDVMPGMVADVLDDIIRCRSRVGTRLDFYKINSHVPGNLVKCAIETAELIASTYGDDMVLPSWNDNETNLFAMEDDDSDDSLYSYDPDESD